jgi:hypothetical protein
MQLVRDDGIEGEVVFIARLLVDPHVVAERFIREMEQHADDDALFVVWFANTHAPWREDRFGRNSRRSGACGD